MDGRDFDELTKKLAKGANRRSFFKGLIGGGAAVVGTKVASSSAGAQGQGQPQVTICHQTGSQSNPFEVITVADESVALERHLRHNDFFFGDCCDDSDCTGAGCGGGECVINDENQAFCSGGTECTGCLECVGTSCQPVNANCADGVACTTDICNADGSCTNTPVNSACDDGDVCNGIETCDPVAGCQPGTPLVCDDGDVCNGIETCDPVAGCQPGTPLVCDDGDVCNGIETCDPVAGCQPGTPLVCDDGDACNGIETCDPVAGCQPGTPVQCGECGICDPVSGACGIDLDNTCTTVDQCEACLADLDSTGAPLGTFSCQISAGQPCDDGNDCTINDVCDALGGCAGTGVQCGECGECDPATGGCIVNPDNTCTTDDQCEACLADLDEDGVDLGTFSCQVDEGATCTDDDLCTINDACNALGVCVGTGVQCGECGECDPLTGGCIVDPDNTCTTDDQCEACLADLDEDGVDLGTFSCQVDEGATCTDDDLCTINDACNALGVCVGTGVQCGDCGECDPLTGGCIVDPDNTCTTDDQCEACLANATGGFDCQINEGQLCTDDDLCTINDACNALGVCVGTGVQCGDCGECDPLTGGCIVDPDNTCTTDDQCEACLANATGGFDCQINEGQLCTDDDLCTINDACNALGVCVGTGVQCGDCGECDPLTGGCIVDPDNTCTTDDQCEACLANATGGFDCQINEGQLCTDNDLCTINDACNALGVCVGTAVPCGDCGVCSGGTCSASTTISCPDPCESCLANTTGGFDCQTDPSELCGTGTTAVCCPSTAPRCSAGTCCPATSSTSCAGVTDGCPCITPIGTEGVCDNGTCFFTCIDGDCTGSNPACDPGQTGEECCCRGVAGTFACKTGSGLCLCNDTGDCAANPGGNLICCEAARSDLGGFCAGGGAACTQLP